jgi:hypothetical protein
MTDAPDEASTRWRSAFTSANTSRAEATASSAMVANPSRKKSVHASQSPLVRRMGTHLKLRTASLPLTLGCQEVLTFLEMTWNEVQTLSDEEAWSLFKVRRQKSSPQS